MGVIQNGLVIEGVESRYTTQVALAAADFLALFTTPVTLVPAPGAGKVVVVESVVFKMVTTGTAFAAGGAVEFRYTNGSGAKVANDVLAAVVTAGAGTSYTSRQGIDATAVANAPIVADAATANFTTGTGTAVVTVKYRIVTP